MPNNDFDFLEDFKRRAGEAGKILAEPVPEPDMYDPNYLPNQPMAGYGLPKVFQAWNALQPEPYEIDTRPPPEQLAKMSPDNQEFYKNLPPLKMGLPTMGTVKFPKVGKAIGKVAAPAGAEAGPMTKKFGDLTGAELPQNMSLVDRIRLAKERSGPIRQTQTFEQAANQGQLEQWKSLPKDFFYDAQTKLYNRRMNQALSEAKDNPELYKRLMEIYNINQ